VNFTLDQEQYEALVALARRGATDANQARDLDSFLKVIEKANGITRDFVLVKWQELNQPLPPGSFFPTDWPPELQRSIEFVTRRVAKSDVERMLAVHAKQPTSVMCTRDPAGIVGLKLLDDFFVN
jgi:hypothetical protein